MHVLCNNRLQLHRCLKYEIDKFLFENATKKATFFYLFYNIQVHSSIDLLICLASLKHTHAFFRALQTRKLNNLSGGLNKIQS
ncbi:hypothetical protein Hanom_Chr02g00145351 [Helianthus anomalus]